LGGARPLEGVFVPDRAAELVCFVVRKALEYATLIEALFLAREGSAIPRELRWLGEGVSEAEIARLLRDHLPGVDLETFRACHNAVASGSALRRFLAGLALS